MVELELILNSMGSFFICMIQSTILSLEKSIVWR